MFIHLFQNGNDIPFLPCSLLPCTQTCLLNLFKWTDFSTWLRILTLNLNSTLFASLWRHWNLAICIIHHTLVLFYCRFLEVRDRVLLYISIIPFMPQIFVCVFAHSFNKCFLKTYHVLNVCWGLGMWWWATPMVPSPAAYWASVFNKHQLNCTLKTKLLGVFLWGVHSPSYNDLT